MLNPVRCSLWYMVFFKFVVSPANIILCKKNKNKKNCLYNFFIFFFSFLQKKGLESFSKKVKLDEDNMIYCDDCGQKAEAYTVSRLLHWISCKTLIYLDHYIYISFKNVLVVWGDCMIRIRILWLPWQTKIYFPKGKVFKSLNCSNFAN